MKKNVLDWGSNMRELKEDELLNISDGPYKNNNKHDGSYIRFTLSPNFRNKSKKKKWFHFFKKN